ncbi:MAG: flagellin FliC [Magnetococcales bacterium]|nr:flagellin FliC [Magnetococcales bacterium]
MALTIATNVLSIATQRNLQRNSTELGKTFERLSSGLRINSASDDSAGLAVATRMTAQIRGFNQAVRNSNDAISLIQVTEGALEETENALQRMRELSVQAASDTLVTTDRQDIWDEIVQLADEIDRIATDTEFNDQVLLGSGGVAALTLTFQVGADANKTIGVTINAAGASVLGVGLNTVGSAGNISGYTQAEAQSHANTMMTLVDSAISSVSDIRSTLGAMQNRFESVITQVTAASEHTEASRARIMDADIATETANLTRLSILQQAGAAILAQANASPQLALQLLG